MMSPRGALGVREYDTGSLSMEGGGNSGVSADTVAQAPDDDDYGTEALINADTRATEGETLTAVDWKPW